MELYTPSIPPPPACLPCSILQADIWSQNCFHWYPNVRQLGPYIAKMSSICQILSCRGEGLAAMTSQSLKETKYPQRV